MSDLLFYLADMSVALGCRPWSGVWCPWSCLRDLGFELGDGPVGEPVVCAGGLESFLKGPVVGGDLADTLLEGGVLGGVLGDPLEGLGVRSRSLVAYCRHAL